MVKLAGLRKTLSYRLTEPVVLLLARTPATPNMLTWCGFLLNVAAGAVVALGQPLVAGLLVLVAGLFDILDGALARRTNQVSRFGAILDSSLDRVSEAAVLIGISVVFAREGSLLGVILANVTLISSLLVSYVRARAEGLGVECQVGIFTRPERVVILALGLVFNQVMIALAIIAVLSIFTAGQRLLHVRHQLK
jgi:CDP-diacylglycerol--glycerol-3-phosphate 3-phosphatidyltransferase